MKTLEEYLQQATRIAVLTGAGMSTESGIPDYRSTDGLYRTLTSEEVFDIDRFQIRPEEFFQVIGPLYISIVKAKPNRGHLALKALEDMGKEIHIATQNIDGLHQKAGSSRVYEVHGTMSTLHCQKCGKHKTDSQCLPLFEKGQVVRCDCGGVMKPDITFYGEGLPEQAFLKSMQAFSRCDLALVMGTSLQVYPAASLPSYRMTGVPLVIINKTHTSMDNEAALVIRQGIGDTLAPCVPAFHSGSDCRVPLASTPCRPIPGPTPAS